MSTSRSANSSSWPTIFRSDAATKAAQAWFEHLGRGGIAADATVAEACARYVTHLRTHKTDRAANDAEISDLVHDGLDLLTVAQISGTSVAMIERHYGHLRSEVAVTALARLAL